MLCELSSEEQNCGNSFGGWGRCGDVGEGGGRGGGAGECGLGRKYLYGVGAGDGYEGCGMEET